MSSSREKQFTELKRIIDHNRYVEKCISNPSKDEASLVYLIDLPMSQSDNIKLGTALENVLKDIIMDKTSLDNIRPRNTKGKKEKDHLFLDPTTKTIYYAELKSNLNLDTEKSKSTYEKCLLNLKELQKEYPEHSVQMFLVGLRYYSKSQMPQKISKRYEPIQSHLVGVNEYLEKLNVPIVFKTLPEYKKFLNYLTEAMFRKVECTASSS